MPQGQGRVAFLPFTRISLKALIQKPYDFEPRMLGDHIRKRRLKLGLMQKEVAQQHGVNTWTVLNWEIGHTQPPIKYIPRIVAFLGYDPFPQPKTISQQLIAKRRAMGWSIEAAAEVVGVDPSTWGDWERGKTILYREHRVAVAHLLDLPKEALD